MRRFMKSAAAELFVPVGGLFVAAALLKAYTASMLTMPLTDAEELLLLDGILADAEYTGHGSHWVGLSSTTPTDAGGNFTEPSGGSYARVARVATDWGAATGTAPATKSSSTVCTFPQATADWAATNLTHFGLWTASSAGTLFAWGLLGTAKPVLNGDTASFAIGALVLKLGKPGDPGL